jgi:hypothetical protein
MRNGWAICARLSSRPCRRWSSALVVVSRAGLPGCDRSVGSGEPDERRPWPGIRRHGTGRASGTSAAIADAARETAILGRDSAGAARTPGPLGPTGRDESMGEVHSGIVRGYQRGTLGRSGHGHWLRMADGEGAGTMHRMHDASDAASPTSFRGTCMGLRRRNCPRRRGSWRISCRRYHREAQCGSYPTPGSVWPRRRGEVRSRVDAVRRGDAALGRGGSTGHLSGRRRRNRRLRLLSVAMSDSRRDVAHYVVSLLRWQHPGPTFADLTATLNEASVSTRARCSRRVLCVAKE